jgi:predicted DCC family thiol-disulfide oxidoreductase YuxK
MSTDTWPSEHARRRRRDVFARHLSPAAPEIPTTSPLIVFDDVCVLCSGFVQWVIAHDPDQLFRFTSAQGPLGQALYRDLGLDPVNFETNLVIVEGKAFGKLDAFIEVAYRLGGLWRAITALRLLSPGLRNWLYDRIARNRYALFGRRETCWLPSADVADRVI